MKKLIFLGIVLWYCFTCPIVIIVHGTFAAEALWCGPKGDFYTILEEEALALGEKVFSFNWSGKLSHSARIQAAEALAKVILDHATERITLIGHSHGGNVINLASQLLHAREKDSFIQAQNAGVDHRSTKVLSQKEYLIDHVYLLATPINMKAYAPNMKVIKHLCNLYSKKDIVQTVFGLYSRCITGSERAINLQVIIEHDEVRKHPSHCQMRHPLLAQWILSIPFKLMEEKCISFENFSWTDDGILFLDKYNMPYYQVIKKEKAQQQAPCQLTVSLRSSDAVIKAMASTSTGIAANMQPSKIPSGDVSAALSGSASGVAPIGAKIAMLAPLPACRSSNDCIRRSPWAKMEGWPNRAPLVVAVSGEAPKERREKAEAAG